MINNTAVLDYADKIATGLASVTADKSKVTLTIRRFSPETGIEMTAHAIDVPSESLDVTIAVIEKRLANLKALKAMIK